MSEIEEIYNNLRDETHQKYQELINKLQAKEQECEELRGVIRKDICSHYVLGECSQKHHNNCVGRNQCIKDLEKECERWKSNFYGKVSAIEELLKQLDQLKAENESLKESFKLISATLNHHLQWEVDVYKRQIDSSVPDDWEYEEVLVLVEEYIEKLKAENEILEKVNKNNQEKIKKLNETLEEEFIAKQYGDEALFFTLMDIKEIAKPYNDMSGNCVIVNCFEDMNKILNIISEVIPDEE